MAAIPVSSSPSSRVELSISCTNLKEQDLFSKSDPIAVLSVRSGGGDAFTEVCNTAVFVPGFCVSLAL